MDDLEVIVYRILPFEFDLFTYFYLSLMVLVMVKESDFFVISFRIYEVFVGGVAIIPVLAVQFF